MDDVRHKEIERIAYEMWEMYKPHHLSPEEVWYRAEQVYEMRNNDSKPKEKNPDSDNICCPNHF